jgi:hypothetical protein
MTTTEAPPQTHAEQREALFLEIAQRREALHQSIARCEREAAALQIKAHEHASWQDHGAARDAMSQAADRHLQIGKARQAIRDLDEERERITRGADTRLSLVSNDERTAFNAAQQGEHREALAAFNALRTPALLAAAIRLVEASKAMGYLPPELATAIVTNA